MKKSSIFTAVAAAIALSASSSLAGSPINIVEMDLPVHNNTHQQDAAKTHDKSSMNHKEGKGRNHDNKMMPHSKSDLEKCHIIDKKTGKSLIKAHKADCNTSKHSCAGHNKAGDPEAWMMVPKGECEKINAGDISGLPKELQGKIDIKKLPKLKK